MTDATRRGTDIDSQLDHASPLAVWLDTPARPVPRPPLDGDVETDLVVIGGGFTGLWTAVRAKERDPDRRVLLLEADRIAEHATGRNGGFCEASLTHGEANGRERWPDEYELLDRLGRENLAEIAGDRGALRHRLRLPHGRRPDGGYARARGGWPSPDEPGFLDADAVRERGVLADIPRRPAGPRQLRARRPRPPGVGPRRRRRVARRPDRRRHPGRRPAGEARPRDGADALGHGDRATGGPGHQRVPRPLLARLRLHTVPVYDYVLATEPLTSEQLASVGWRDRLGISDSSNQFHYYRLTPDDRILWGGYDAIYHFGRRIDPSLDDRRATHRLLAEQFYETFPQLRDVRFTHRWGGVIDTWTRFCAFFGTGLRGRVAYALGFTGLGVGASRFAADRCSTCSPATGRSARSSDGAQAPVPFPPEPLAWLGIQLTRWSMAREDLSDAATCLGCSTGSGSGSTAEPSVPTRSAASPRSPRSTSSPSSSTRR